MWWYDKRSQRIHEMYYVIIGVILLLLLRLFWMQVLQGPQYKRVAEQNRIRQVDILAPRGSMYDRKGAVIAGNRPSFAVSILPAEYSNPQRVTPLLAELTGVSTAQITQLLAAAEDSPFTPLRIKVDADTPLIIRITEQRQELPGVIIEALPVRHYPYQNLAAHVLGYVGALNEEEYAKYKEKGYRLNDRIGKGGLEYEWEEFLRGRDGGRQVEINAAGEEVALLGDKAPLPGKDIILTLDGNLQKVAEDALAAQVIVSRNNGAPARGGSVIVLDAHTGGVLVLASNPSFDPNLFSGGISTAKWNQLLQDPYDPLTNKAIQGTYPPASVFKIITAAAALDKGYVTPAEIFHDKGVYVLNGWKFYGWDKDGLGDLTLVDAIAWSSDPVFYELGRRLGADTLANYAATFGLGSKTGIQLPGEEVGVVPTEAWKTEKYGEIWYPGETLIAAIGQGYYLVTPLQQTMLLMAVANGGVMYRPQLVNRVLQQDGSVVREMTPEIAREVYLRPEDWGTIRQGLAAVVAEGTGSTAFKGFQPAIAGKSGSGESGRGTVHAWFACYAPADNPEIIAMAMVEDGGEGSGAAAPIVRKVLEAYFQH